MTAATANRLDPRPRLGDHLRVAWLLVKTVFALLPYLVCVPLSPVLGSWLRRRCRRRLAAGADTPVGRAEALWARAGDPGPRRIFLVAGEASGDRMAARLVAEIRARCPGVRIEGYAGPACRAAGMRLHRDLTAHSVMGIFAVAGTLSFWWRVCAETLARFRERPPDLLLTVDFPGLNVRLAGWAHACGIPTVHLVAPQVWAHAPWRILRWRGAVDHLLALLPFEPRVFRPAGVRTTYVGHPLFEAPLPPPRAPAEPSAGAPTFELWPGSRAKELRRHVPILAAAADELGRRFAGARLVLVLAETAHEAPVRALWEAAAPDTACPAVRVGAGAPDASLAGALVTSGTATAQVAVDLVPQVVFYRVGLVNRVLARLAFSTPWIALANLVAGRVVAPECLVGGPRGAARLCRALERQIRTPEARATGRAALAQVRARLAVPDVASRAAALVVAELRREA